MTDLLITFGLLAIVLAVVFLLYRWSRAAGQRAGRVHGAESMDGVTRAMPPLPDIPTLRASTNPFDRADYPGAKPVDEERNDG